MIEKGGVSVSHKREPWEVIEAFGERAAIVEYCGRQPRARAEQIALQERRQAGDAIPASIRDQIRETLAVFAAQAEQNRTINPAQIGPGWANLS